MEDPPLQPRPLVLPHTAFEGLCTRQVVGQFAAAGAELKGLLHLLEHLLVVLEGDFFGLPLNSSPAGGHRDIMNQ